jgi:uncharacterized membrane protein
MTDQASAQHTRRRRRRWYQPVSLMLGLWARPKILVGTAAGIVMLLAAPLVSPSLQLVSARAAAGWNAGALVYLGMAFWIMSKCDAGHIRLSAAREDESRFVFLVMILLAVASSFTAVVALIGDARQGTAGQKAFYLLLAGATVLTSWLVMQVVFTLHYAHDYYRPNETLRDLEKGLAFPGQEQPDYWDFFYFSTSIGATSQTSDVSITSSLLRRQVTLHAVLSFVFNTTILALAINLASSLVGG